MWKPILVVLCLTSTLAFAHESKEHASPSEERVADDPRDPSVTAANATATRPEPHWALQLGLGTVGNLVGVLGLGALGSVFGVGGLDKIAMGILIGASAGALLGSTLGTLLLGDATRFWGTFLGAATGLAASLLLLPVLGGAAIVAAFILPPIGAVVGYQLARPAAPAHSSSQQAGPRPRLALVPFAVPEARGLALTGTF